MVVPTSRSQDLERVFDEQNPWHETGRVDAVSAPPTERPLAALLWRRLMDHRLPRYQLIVGPRRVGKTTALYQTVRRLLGEGVNPDRVWWLRMDHPLLMQQSLGDLAREVLHRSGAAADRPVFLMLDELVYAADWDAWLKTFHDDRWPVKVAATSSATAALRNRRHESGVGRWEVQYLTPYLLTEYLDLVGQPHETDTGDSLAETLSALRRGERAPREAADRRKSLMLTGGFPELLDPTRQSGEDDERERLLRSQQALRSDAVERAVYKDIPQSFGVGNPLMLERLLYVLAGQMTGVLSPANVCKELGMSQPTFDTYLSYLESAFLVFTLPNFSGREATIQKRGRKLFFWDGAVRNAALQRGPALLDDPAEMGSLLENLAASSLYSLAVRSGVRLHYWREGRDEVDLVFNHPGRPLAFEVASSPGHTRSGLHALMERHPQFRGACYLVAPQASTIHPDESTPGTLPLDLFLLAVSAQAHHALNRSMGR